MTTTTATRGTVPRTRTARAVRIRGLRKRYGAHQALDGVDLDIAHGEIFALLGPNGAGKTTIVEILEGFRSRDSGEVAVLGADPATADRDWRARIGVVLQDTRGRSDLSVAEVVRATARYYPHPRNADDVIDLVGLAGHTGKRVHALSGGQQRRLDVALGIVGRPELLFLDEPTTGFDPEARRAFWDLVRSLRDDGTTVLLTTHYLDEAAALADRAAVIRAGRVVALGTPDTLGGLSARTPVVRWRAGGVLHEERTTTPTALVTRLAAKAAPGHEVDGLTVTRPSLEDVYLDLIHGEPASHGEDAS